MVNPFVVAAILAGHFLGVGGGFQGSSWNNYMETGPAG